MISEVSKRYARAIFEAAKEISKTDIVFSELRAVASIISSDVEINKFINSPLNSSETKAQVLSKALSGKVSDQTMGFLLLLTNKGRISLFGEIVSAFEAISDEAHGVSRGRVRSAAALGPDQRQKVEQIVNKVTKKKVILTFEEDSKILGGMVAQVGGWTFNDSIDSHLNRLNDELNRRSN